ncbi:phosphatidylserine decarboxylase-domain-containing protein [Lobosporangium transversale]|uniref:phosphatidylserine decarboxylase n=1 Tax=Lobosporangium transversale TaxID=64571 RepID=A0A1Y2GF24_9FUNG|nr:phosphatidylserine decarboxylase-domain-containing protein [Lobosporangium transversale]ORZ09079.1 phosphatidylserine decarboxylase-domain-containing protein [Lobosporangium transversale]|eukprot:XP_021878706.1 phosphatidylserine decarboxylase-domain-containing protein [Lobosporangium transversale]
MPIYVRIGMHLLFATMLDRKLLQTHKIHHLFSAESVKQGKHFDASESVAQIEHFIKTYKLDLSELLQPDLKQYKSFNEFFYRKLRPDARPIHFVDNPNIIVSSADCRLCVFESISAATQVWIKGKLFSIKELLKDEILASKYEGGSIALFRLAPQDYHRFHSPVTGTIVKEPFKIAGTYYTVNPMAVNSDINVFTENVRQVTLIDLEQEEGKDEDEGSNNSNSTNTGGRNAQFDQCVFVSIGALLVGSVQLTGAKEPGNRVRKGDELGFFAYGGSTCILLFKAGAVQFDQDLVASSLKGIETLVRMGECIGERK